MVDLLELQKEFLRKHIGKGSVVCDFTAGNGHDSEFLSKTVGETGRLYAFDIQSAACESTKNHLAESGCPQNYTIINDSHANCKEYVHEKINAGMFNLGWLPGSDRKVTTRRESTLKAVNAAIGQSFCNRRRLILRQGQHCEIDVVTVAEVLEMRRVVDAHAADVPPDQVGLEVE